VLDALQAVLIAASSVSTAILLAAVGGLLNRQGGIVNVGLEGKMLVGAFTAVVVGAASASSLLGVLAAATAGGLVGLVFSWTITRLDANQIIAGLGLNVFAVGLFGYLLPVLYGVQGTYKPVGIPALPSVTIPLVSQVPFVGPILSGQDPLTYLSWLSVPLASIFLYRTALGLELRATGANEEAARSAGISTLLLRDLSTVTAGVLAGLAGAQLSLGVVQLFNKQMTGGRGFIALAAFYFGDARPVPTAVGALLFGTFEALSFRLQASAALPPQVIQTLPYVVVLASLGLVALRRQLALHRLHSGA
jgi:simple sugar transport system permease protein